MQALREPEVLDALDVGDARSSEALDALVARRIGTAPSELPVGRRDAELVRLRMVTFGQRASVRATCAGCGEQLEADLDLGVLPLDTPTQTVTTFEYGGVLHEIRLPTGDDLRAAANARDPQAELIRRCCDDPLLVTDEQAVAAIEQAIETADPLVDVSIDMPCPACSLVETRRFDIAEYLWHELVGYGRRLTLEVHWLASRYGWTEGDVLALSPARRRAYLELAPS